MPLTAKIDFFTLSELIEQVSPRAAQLGIHFLYFFHYTQLEVQLLINDIRQVKERRKREREKGQ